MRRNNVIERGLQQRQAGIEPPAHGEAQRRIVAFYQRFGEMFAVIRKDGEIRVCAGNSFSITCLWNRPAFLLLPVPEAGL